MKNSAESVSFSIETSLCGVIMGAKFPEENRESLEKAIEYCNPKIKRLYISWHYGMPDVTDPKHWEKMMDSVSEI